MGVIIPIKMEGGNLEHSVDAYLRRQSTQTLENLLQQYMYKEGHYRQLVPVIAKILEDRRILLPEKKE